MEKGNVGKEEDEGESEAQVEKRKRERLSRDQVRVPAQKTCPA